MKRLSKYVLFSFLLLIPSYIFAEELLSEEVKYFKTYEYVMDSTIMQDNTDTILSETVEITEEEFNSASVDEEFQTRDTVQVNTNYKRMTTRLYANGLYYRYEVNLFWKKFPAKRSYDIIGIGFYSSVKPTGTISFQQEACTSSTNCTFYNTNYPQTFNMGVGTSFKLPTTTSLTLLQQTLAFNVTKVDPNSTIINQRAAGDYAHATSNISLANSKKYTLNYSYGLSLDSSITSYYDTISAAIAAWSGTW